MLAALAVNWAFLLLRAVIALLFGAVAILWPDHRLMSMVLLFGAYALSDGVLALIVALNVKGHSGFGSLLFEAIVRLGVGVFAFVAPYLTALALMNVFAAWAILSGVAAIAAAVALSRDLVGEWPLPFAGAVSIVAGVFLLVRPGSLEPAWVFGPYTVLFGMTLLALTQRLRQLAREIVAAG